MPVIAANINTPFELSLTTTATALQLTQQNTVGVGAFLWAKTEWLYGGEDGAVYVPVPANTMLPVEFLYSDTLIYAKHTATGTLYGLVVPHY